METFMVTIFGAITFIGIVAAVVFVGVVLCGLISWMNNGSH